MVTQQTPDSTLLLLTAAVQKQTAHLQQCHRQHEAAEDELDILLTAIDIAVQVHRRGHIMHTYHLQGLVTANCPGCAMDGLVGVSQQVHSWRASRRWTP